VSNIHQVLAAYSGGDAVSAYARLIQQHLLAFGADSRIFAASVEPAQLGRALPLHRLRYAARDDDALIYHHSIGSEALDVVARSSGPKLLIYHNITPGHYVRAHCPTLADELDAGRRSLPSLAQRFDLAATVSRFNASELRSAGFDCVELLTIPIDPRAFNRTRFVDVAALAPDGSPMFLFVGRLLPHKCPHELIAWFHDYAERVDPDATLVIVGGMDDRFAPYNRDLLGVAAAGSGRVRLMGKVDGDTLVSLYRRADVFVSFSEHEGFMVPLTEAMATETAVLAYDIPAVRETLDDAGVRFSSKRRFAVHELAHALTHDEEIRAAILERQRRRVAAFSPTQFERRLAGVIDRWLALEPAR
jgi:glycosyltransferase involved in cell wall biosynthesis